jgi:hypothetical protein
MAAGRTTLFMSLAEWTTTALTPVEFDPMETFGLGDA